MQYPNWHFAYAPCEPAGAQPPQSAPDEAALSQILAKRSIRTVFQPIVSLETGRVLGYEALSRGPAGTTYEQPALLFEAARQTGHLWELDSLCRLQALDAISRLGMDCRFFINIDPHVLNDRNFMTGFTRRYLDQFQIDPNQIVFEVTEHSRIQDGELYKSAISHYKQQGYQIAIDDTGTGYSGLKLIADLHPQFIKLDMDLIRGVEQDTLKQALVRAMCDFCRAVNIRIIAEGIETEAELAAVIELGAHFGQGFLLGRPSELCAEPNEATLRLIERHGRNNRQVQAIVAVGDICVGCRSIPPTSTCRVAYDLFESNPDLYGLPVVENGTVAGLITRQSFYARLGTQFGYDLYIRRPVSMLMEGAPLTVDDRTSIEQVSRQAMLRSHDRLYNPIIVERDNRYLGLVSVKDLLEATMDIQVTKARHMNPLTGLPGNVLIQQRLQQCLNEGAGSHVLYLDIDNFKAYNDSYGFESGDRVILFVAEVLQAVLMDRGGRNTFAGHIGGDDFIAVVDAGHSEAVCREIVARFDEGIVQYHPQEHLLRGGYPGRDRGGREVLFGITSLSIAVVPTGKHDFRDPITLSEYASRLKTACKALPGSNYLVD